MQTGLEVVGLGKCVGTTDVSNELLSTKIDTSDEWIYSRTGIKKRQLSAISLAQMSATAVANALEDAKCQIEDVDVLIVATTTAENLMPSTATKVMELLHFKHSCIAFDMNVACSGFVYALDIAKLYANRPNIGTIVVIGCEKYSSVLDWTDRSTCVLFGDAASAVVLQRSSEAGVHDALLENTVDENSVLNLAAKHSSNCPFILEGAQQPTQYLTMKGPEVFKFAIKATTAAIKTYLQQQDLAIDDLDYIVCHQANIRILHTMAKQLKIPTERLFTNLAQYGNTGAASIPLALTEMKEQHLLTKGKKLLCVGFGGGLSCGVILIEIKR